MAAALVKAFGQFANGADDGLVAGHGALDHVGKDFNHGLVESEVCHPALSRGVNGILFAGHKSSVSLSITGAKGL